MQTYFENDVNPSVLDNLNVAVIGYGSQGRGQSLNLRDSGVNVCVGLREGGESWNKAVEDGWSPLPMDQAVRQSDLICFLAADTAQAEIYYEHVKPNLKPGSTICFAHGFNIHFGFIKPEPETNVILVAPKGPGKQVRQLYLDGYGLPSLIAVHQQSNTHQNPGATAHDLALAFGWGIGSARVGLMETTFAEETVTDLFSEQTVLCGGLIELILAAWETLVEAGYQPEAAYFECLTEVKLIADLIYEGGLTRMYEIISGTAAYGGLTAGKRVIGAETRLAMKQILSEIQDGTFAKNWQSEFTSGNVNFRSMVQQTVAHPIESVGKSVRERFAVGSRGT